MKRQLLLIAGIISITALNAQVDLKLNMTHVWNGNLFNLGQQYTDAQGTLVEVNRVQYYLSGFEVTHDGGQTTTLTGTYVLGNGNQTNYNLTSANVTNLEGISFDLGVDSVTNHLDPTLYGHQNPLAPQTPSMHWGWNAGYRFVAIEGLADTDNDGIVDAPFEFHVTADDDYLRNVLPIATSGNLNGTDLEIDIYVNVADWLKDIDLKTAGYNHGVFPLNEQVMDNTNTYVVFDVNSTLSIDEAQNTKNNILVNYSMPYAPTIFYKFPSSNKVNLKIVDMSGKTVLSEVNMQKSGTYFINKELAPGTYIANFTDDKGISFSEKLVVQ
jgi:hypothetical protein